MPLIGAARLVVRRVGAGVLLVLGASVSTRPVPAPQAWATAVAPHPLLGAWILNRARTHYGRGADPRIRETFVCTSALAAAGAAAGAGAGTTPVTCTIRSQRRGVDRELVGQFVAGVDGVARPVAGMPGMDAVVLVPVAGVPGAIDATFRERGTPVYAYRAFRAPDGRSLTIVAVHPVTRVVLTSLVVYDRATR